MTNEIIDVLEAKMSITGVEKRKISSQVDILKLNIVSSIECLIVSSGSKVLRFKDTYLSIQNNFTSMSLKDDGEGNILLDTPVFVNTKKQDIRYWSIAISQEINESSDFSLITLVDTDKNLYFVELSELPVGELYTLYSALVALPNTFVV